MPYDKESFLAGLAMGRMTWRPPRSEVSPGFLSFISPSDFRLSTLNNSPGWNGIIEYSTDLRTWRVWDGVITLTSASGRLFLRGTGNTKITGQSDPGYQYSWKIDGSDVRCIGNIENLLDYMTVAANEHPTMAGYCYAYMFYDCIALTTPPELPATTLTSSCYGYMFQGCSSLKEVPELPATTLTVSCYIYLFRNCTSITTPPKLPATNLASYCYCGMFQGCTSLEEAPELPATTLVSNCYISMFYNCRSIKLPPQLPATRVVTQCYRAMFNGCSSLVALPQLPAITLATDCYTFMFQGCTSIKLSTTQTGEYQHEYRIPTTGTGVDAATSGLTNMFRTTGGTFKGTPAINTTYYVAATVGCLTFQSIQTFTLNTVNNTPGWDGVLEYSTDLNTWQIWDGISTVSSVHGYLFLRGTGNTMITGHNMTDAQNYYWNLTGSNIYCMGNIENLLDYQTVLAGNHPTMTTSCYAYLFYNCTALVSPPALPAPTLASSCYYAMFQGCTSLVTAPQLPATTLAAGYCYSRMFRECTSLVSSPVLPATTLSTYCYTGMFRDCTSLTVLPQLPALTLKSNCYYGMFQGCSLIKLSITQDAEYQYAYQIPTNGGGTDATSALAYMFGGTGGSFTGAPTINTMYYTANEVI